MSKTFEKASAFIYRNARSLDLARWQYHFEGGSKEAVLTVLTAYQNKDNGLGHALERYMWNLNSSPMQTWAATETLQEIDLADKNHPIIEGILNYFSSGQDFEGRVWYNPGKYNNDYPHAP